MTVSRATIIFKTHMYAAQRRRLSTYEKEQLRIASAVLRRARHSAMRGNPGKSTRAQGGKKVARIYGRVLRIEAQKVGPHGNCDAECKRCKHKYFHDFKPGAKMLGLRPGQVIKIPAGCYPLLIM